MADSIAVQVCYAKPESAIMRQVSVPAGATVEQAIRLSGILPQAPEIDLAHNRTGIFGKLKPLDAPVREHDRVEIYRPLIADPKEARRRRAEKR
ncbi:MAG: protein RnfH [Burkholderiaceae bacterium]|nr:protein RnfH [Burkholderiaceae bacterium]